MTPVLEIYRGVPIPETRGRKSGSRASNHADKQAIIAKGVAIVEAGASFLAAAEAIREDYPRKPISKEYLANLIRQAAKR